MNAPQPARRAFAPWILTASGIRFDLLNPTPAMVHWPDVAESLAKLARFNGHTAAFYSVAQHCVLGADALLQETEDPRLAALFLLHDAHEAALGDETTPFAKAKAEKAARIAFEQHINSNPGLGEHACRVAQWVKCLVLEAGEALKHQTDLEIYKAAQIEPPSESERTAIKHMDQRMLAAEMRQLWARAPAKVITAALEEAGVAHLPPVRLHGRIRPLPWPDAATAWLTRAKRWLPALKG